MAKKKEFLKGQRAQTNREDSAQIGDEDWNKNPQRMVEIRFVKRDPKHETQYYADGGESDQYSDYDKAHPMYAAVKHNPGKSALGAGVLAGGAASMVSRIMKKRAAMGMAGGGMVGAKASGYVDHEGNDVKHNMSAMQEDDMGFNQHGASDEGAGDMNSLSPMVRKIMMGRAQGYSKGGMTANDTGPMADFEENEFDDLHLRDGLEQSYTEANSGDELGNAREDMDRSDIVSRILASRRKKDRNPRPA